MRSIVYGCFMLLALMAVPAHADECSDAHQRHKTVGAAVEDTQILKLVTEVLRATSLEQKPVRVCRLTLPLINATVDNMGSYYLVGLSDGLLARCTNSEIRAALGHEVGHIVLGHRAQPFKADARTFEREEAADAYAVSLFGASGMQTLLAKLLGDSIDLPAKDRLWASRELPARIRAINKRVESGS